MTDEDELAGTAVSALCWIAAGHSQEKRRWRFEGSGGWCGCLEVSSAACELGGFVAIGGEAVVSNALEARWQHMPQEAAQEFLVGRAHDLLFMRGAAVWRPIAKADLSIIDANEALIADGNAMGIPGEILQHVFRAGQWRLQVHHPRLLAQRLDEGGPSGMLGEILRPVQGVVLS